MNFMFEDVKLWPQQQVENNYGLSFFHRNLDSK